MYFSIDLIFFGIVSTLILSVKNSDGGGRGGAGGGGGRTIWTKSVKCDKSYLLTVPKIIS